MTSFSSPIRGRDVSGTETRFDEGIDVEVAGGQTEAMTRALVLGGGGLVGIAWEVGILTGLAQSGFDLSGPAQGNGHESGHQPDSIVGTSAGSVVGSLLGTVGLGEMATMALDDARAAVAMENLPLQHWFN